MPKMAHFAQTHKSMRAKLVGAHDIIKWTFSLTFNARYVSLFHPVSIHPKIQCRYIVLMKLTAFSLIRRACVKKLANQ